MGKVLKTNGTLIVIGALGLNFHLSLFFCIFQIETIEQEEVAEAASDFHPIFPLSHPRKLNAIVNAERRSFGVRRWRRLLRIGRYSDSAHWRKLRVTDPDRDRRRRRMDVVMGGSSSVGGGNGGTAGTVEFMLKLNLA